MPKSRSARTKKLAELVLRRVASTRLAAGRLIERVLVLAYHNIVPDGDPPRGDRNLHLTLSSFRAHVRYLSSVADVVRLEDALSSNARATRPRVVITFDDAYRGATILGCSELALHGMPATIFVAPPMLGTTFWWDHWAPPSGVWEVDLRDRLLAQLGGCQARIDEWAAISRVPRAETGPWLRAASEGELCNALARGHVELGSHSWSHPNLAALEGVQLAEELSRPLAWLKTRFDRVVPWLAYPYGRFTKSTIEAVEAAGYKGALAINGGWWPRLPLERFSLARWNVPSAISLDGFKIRLGGLLC